MMKCPLTLLFAMVLPAFATVGHAQEASMEVILPGGNDAALDSDGQTVLPVTSANSGTWPIGCRITAGLYASEVAAFGQLTWKHLGTGQPIGALDWNRIQVAADPTRAGSRAPSSVDPNH